MFTPTKSFQADGRKRLPLSFAVRESAQSHISRDVAFDATEESPCRTREETMARLSAALRFEARRAVRSSPGWALEPRCGVGALEPNHSLQRKLPSVFRYRV